MGVYDEIKVKITGQVECEFNNVKRKVLADLEAVCAKFDLELEEVN